MKKRYDVAFELGGPESAWMWSGWADGPEEAREAFWEEWHDLGTEGPHIRSVHWEEPEPTKVTVSEAQ